MVAHLFLPARRSRRDLRASLAVLAGILTGATATLERLSLTPTRLFEGKGNQKAGGVVFAENLAVLNALGKLAALVPLSRSNKI